MILASNQIMRQQENPAHHERDYRLSPRFVTRREQGAMRPVRRRPAVVRRWRAVAAWDRETARSLMSHHALEIGTSWRVLSRMGLIMIDLLCASFKRVPERVVLDIDDTDDTVHGGQQLARQCQCKLT